MSDGATQYPALIHVDNVKPSVYVKSSSFIFRKDHTVARHASGIYGQHSLTNHKASTCYIPPSLYRRLNARDESGRVSITILRGDEP